MAKNIRNGNTPAGSAVAIFLISWKLITYSDAETGECCCMARSTAKKGVSYLPDIVFLAYPGFSSYFFNALQCRTIDGTDYLIADLGVKCSGANYNILRAVAVVFVLFWSFGLPVAVTRTLWHERGNLREEGQQKVQGMSEHLKEFYTPYKPKFWFFDSFEFAKKVFLVGIFPWL